VVYTPASEGIEDVVVDPSQESLFLFLLHQIVNHNANIDNEEKRKGAPFMNYGYNGKTREKTMPQISSLISAFIISLSMCYAHHGPITKDTRSNAEWKKVLSAEQYEILRNEGTEPAHSSELDKEYRKGAFVCAGCGLELFRSETKYNSGTGWPSFWEPIKGHIETKTDWKLIWPRTEYHCARCGGHQGHVFDDGPAEHGGKRYCNNGLALKFIPDSIEEVQNG
jgi:peptide-methionine (R)-S-oxide reductase